MHVQRINRESQEVIQDKSSSVEYGELRTGRTRRAAKHKELFQHWKAFDYGKLIFLIDINA